MDDELKHHGILGMKWGVRRTPAQLGHRVARATAKKRLKNQIVSSGKSIVKKGKFTKADGKLKGSGQKAKRQELKEKKQQILKSRSAKQLYDNADLFTTQELQSAYNRLVLEQNIQRLTPTQKSRGERFVDETIKWSNKASNLIEGGTKAYNSIAKIYNVTKEGRKNPVPIVGTQQNNKSNDKN